MTDLYLHARVKDTRENRRPASTLFVFVDLLFSSFILKDIFLPLLGEHMIVQLMHRKGREMGGIHAERSAGSRVEPATPRLALWSTCDMRLVHYSTKRPQIFYFRV